jgi:hypothetical protein
MATQYYIAKSILTYGAPATGYHTSIASGAVYKNLKGELTYLLYNPTENAIDVTIYKDGNAIETIKVGGRKYYNSRMTGVQKPSVTITSHKANDKMALNDLVTVSASASDKDGTVQSVEFFLADVSVGVAITEPYSISFRPAGSGIVQLKAIATDNEGNKSDAYSIPIEVLSTPQTSYITRPWNIPGDKIIAVQFDKGGAEISCHDNEIAIQGGNNLRADTGVETENSNGTDGNIGYTNPGEWYEYTVNVQQTGIYAISALMSSAGGGALHLEFDGVNKTGSLTINKTGSWGAYKDTTIANIPLQAGTQVMRVYIDRAGVNISSYRFANVTGVSNPRNEQISISPNPFSNYIRIKSDSQNAVKKVTIYTLTGEIILEKIGNTTEVVLNTSELKNGCYLLKVERNESSFTTKIIK